MKRHDAPFVSHWLHAYANDVGLFVQLPRVLVSVCPTSAVPLMTGAFVFLGTAVLAARPLPGCPMTAPRMAPAPTARTIPSLARVRWPRSMAGSFGLFVRRVIYVANGPFTNLNDPFLADSFQARFREAARPRRAARARSTAARRRGSRPRRRVLRPPPGAGASPSPAPHRSLRAAVPAPRRAACTSPARSRGS